MLQISSKDVNLQQYQHSGNVALQRPVLPNRNRLAIFIDAPNVFYAAKQLGRQVTKYQQLKAYLAAGFFLTSARFYTGVDSTNLSQKGFLSYLRHIGFEVIAKELVKRVDGSQKANLDVKIALDMRNFVDSYDTAVLVSGDGDFVWAVEELQNYGKQVWVVGLDSMTSYELRQVANRFTDLADILDKI
jgi:uncharacterized LabA/DUF88 family protein